ncbi:MAG: DHH family phosphoesterase [Thermoplasmata archaeon]
MYIIYADDFDLDMIEPQFEGMDKEIKYFEKRKKDEDDVISFIKNRSSETDGIAYLGIDQDPMIFLSKKVMDIDPEIHQIGCPKDSENLDELEEKSLLNEVVKSEGLVINTVLKSFQEIGMRKKSQELKRAISSCEGKLGIYIHDDPDMDAIGSAMAFEIICDEEGIESTIYYHGSISPTVNEIFLGSTDPLFEKIDTENIERYLEENDKIAFLDFADHSHCDPLPEEVEPDIILDHHSTSQGIKAREFTEIRADVGATATLITKHLLNLEVDIPPMIASTLLVGIKTDTSDYTKNISSTDYKVISYLSSISDKDILDVLENPPISSETFTAMGSAIFNRRIKEDVLTTFCREVHHTEGIAKIADLLLRERDILTVLVYGVKEDEIHMSARSKDMQSNMGEIMERAFADIGEAGGHPHAAGGKISLDRFEDEIEAVEMIEERFHEEVF